NDGDLVGIRGIVSDAVGDGTGVEDTVAILVLQAFAREGGSSGRAAAKKALASSVAERPDEIAHALESEHGIVDEERDHLRAIIRISRARRGERRNRTSLGDAFFQDVAVSRLLVVQEH